MGFLGKQLLKVIEWIDSSSDTIIYKYPVTNRYAVMKGSQLVVRPGQRAVFVNEGKIADIFQEGRYTLDTNNLPFLTGLMNWKYAFENPFKADIFFINTNQFTDLKWGTVNPIMMRDTDFGVIRLRGFGKFAIQVKDDEALIKQLFGAKNIARVGAISEFFKSMLVSGLSDAIAESKIPALDLAMNFNELSEFAIKDLQPKFNQYGLNLTNLIIENLSLPEEVEKNMDTRTSMGVIGDMGKFTQFQAAQAMRDAANNESGNMASAGVGIGAGMGIGNMMAQAFGGLKQTESASTATSKCPKCGASVKDGAMFCPDCGLKLGNEKCPKCGASVKASAKFCPECGEKLGATKCAKCGAELKAGAKFCPECGEKVVAVK